MVLLHAQDLGRMGWMHAHDAAAATTADARAGFCVAQQDFEGGKLHGVHGNVDGTWSWSGQCHKDGLDVSLVGL